jgi:capsular polysaccharide export protein
MSARLDTEQALRYQQGDYTLPGIYHLLHCKRVLLLQGPMGNFFNRFADWLKVQNIDVRKINFNGGDWLFHRHLNATDFRGYLDEFPDFLREFIEEHDIDGIVCFGDCRHYHTVAAEIAAILDIPFFVFEEGYIRPDYITLERGGVNFHSLLPRIPDFYRALPEIDVAKPEPAYPSFYLAALSAIVYYAAGSLLRSRYPGYRHHKIFSIAYEARAWGRSLVRKYLNSWRDKPVFDKLLELHQDRYFAVALQVYNDSQVLRHSAYLDVREFITEVVVSFATHADARHHLVFKHHPMDRGQRDYRPLINKLCEENGVAGRVHYVHDVHLPTLLKHSRGVLTINSTVGLSAIYHGKSLITMGRALYDLAGLTFQGELAQFWSFRGRVDKVLWRRFRAFLVTQTQLNGAFYGRNHYKQTSIEMSFKNIQRAAPLALHSKTGVAALAAVKKSESVNDEIYAQIIALKER